MADVIIVKQGARGTHVAYRLSIDGNIGAHRPIGFVDAAVIYDAVQEGNEQRAADLIRALGGGDASVIHLLSLFRQYPDGIAEHSTKQLPKKERRNVRAR